MNSRPLQSLGRTIRAEYGSLVEPGCCLLLAVSGGSDSLALMHLTAAFAADFELRLHVGFVDHGLRSGVDTERRLVAGQAERLGLAFHGVAIPHDRVENGIAGDSLQQWARNERYRLLEELAVRVGASHVVTGHTLDDQAETFLLRLLRGTGLDGLRCIPRSRPLGRTHLIRPLLGVLRSTLREYLASKKLSWADDPSNEDRRYTRVSVRQQLLPLMESLQPGVAGRLGQLVHEIEAVSTVVDVSVDMKNKGTPLKLSTGLKVPRSYFDALPKELWPRLVRRALAEVRGDLRRIERVHVDQLVEQVAGKDVTSGTPMPGTAVIFASRGDLYVFRDKPLLPDAGAVRVVGSSGDRLEVEWLNLGVRAIIKSDNSLDHARFTFREWQPGDRLYGSRSSLKKIFQRGAVPLIYRGIYPVVLYEKQVFAAPEILPTRLEGVTVDWMLDENSPFEDLL